MSILIIAATAPELTPFTSMNEDQHGIVVDTMVTGVGLLSTAASLAKRIHQKRPSLVIQAGIAGSFDDQLPLGQAVVVASDAIGDLGVVENGIFKTIFEMGLADPDEFPHKAGKLFNPHTALLKGCGLPLVHGISINEISTSTDRIRYYRQYWSADIETMEGAALHRICLDYEIPFLQIRGISNLIGERDKSKWMIKEAAASVAQSIHTLLNNLSEKP